MKRLFCLLLVVFMVPAFALAESVDLSSLSFEELRTLQSRIAKEMTSRPEWKEVNVPMGQWRIGVDIPAGAYQITCDNNSTLIQVWKVAVDNYENNGCVYNEIISNKTPLGKIILEEGWLFTTTAPVVFSPAVSLVF